MSRQAAKAIVDLMVRQGAQQNALLAEIRSSCTEDEFQRFKSMIGRSMASMLLDVINPIVEMHPDLRPPKLDD
jgi:hypothetical protein